MLLFSVVICTYNRASLLPTALQTVCEQALDCTEYEVLVVDNNSTDETRFVTESFMQRYSNVRYCFEPQQGLSYARNRGWQEARGKYVAYTDDECKVPPQWLTVAKEVIIKHYQKWACFGRSARKQLYRQWLQRVNSQRSAHFCGWI